MLYGEIIHPPLLGALSAAGHGSTVLITDGNYPTATGVNPLAEKIFLNFAPGQLSVTDILAKLVKTIPIEAATVMSPKDGTEIAAHADFRAILPKDVEFHEIGRFEFYEKCRESDLAVVIASGEQRIYANLLLTIGVRKPE